MVQVMTTQIDNRLWKDEFINYIVNKLYTLDSQSRYSQDTLNTIGDGTTTKFLLSSSLRAISSVTVDGDTVDYGADYLPVFDSDSADIGKIVFTTAPGDGEAVVVTFIEGAIGWIYADFPRQDLAISRYPRVGITMVKSPVVGGQGGSTKNVLKNLVRFSVLLLSENTRLLDKLQKELDDNISADAKLFYNWRYIRPDITRDISNSEDATNSVLLRNMDFVIENRYEFITYNT